MGDATNIEWTEATWSPVTGCSKVSPGCARCYAEVLACGRLKGTRGYPGLPWTPANAATNVVLHPERLMVPLKWGKPRMIFVCSMADLFHERVPREFLAQVFAVMRVASRHTFQVLTKRPERARELLRETEFIEAVEAHAQRLDATLEPFPWPLPNVWLGTSIENRRFVHRADLLRETPAAVRFISAEPLLGPLVPLAHVGGEREKFGLPAFVWEDHKAGDNPGLTLDGIDWLIIGGESGPGYRPMDLEWAHALLDLAGHTDTACFFKQLGGPRSGTDLLDLPPDLRIREFPVVGGRP